MVNKRIQALAPDLTLVAPRSARTALGPYRAIAARAVDKCRAELAGRAGSYNYNCSLDRAFLNSPASMPRNSNNSLGRAQATKKSSDGSLKNPVFTTPGGLPCGANGFDLTH